jgi:two-component system, LuxR family, sensor kinase FixL
VTHSLISPTDAGIPPGQSATAAERFVKAALDALSAHVAVLDESSVIIYVNKAWQRFAEENGYYDRHHGVGQNYLKICDDSSQTSREAALIARGIRAVRLRETDEFHMEYPCHSITEKRWFVVRVTRFNWYGHNRLIIAHQNVTEIKRSQQEVTEGKRWLEAILDNLVDGVISFDDHGKIETLNRAGAYIFGYEQKEVIGQNLRMLLPDLSAKSGEAELSKLLKRTNGLGDEIEGKRHDGSVFPMYFAVSEVRIDHKRLYTAIIQDFTERKFLEAQVWDRERLNLELETERTLREAKNRFISMVSHDLKTPLAAVRLANSMLRNYGHISTAEENKEAYDTIDQQVGYLTELINDVISISRTDFNGNELNREPVDLETYLRDIIEEMTFTHRDRRTLIFDGTNHRVEAMVDRKLMHRAISNLLTNAIKYSPDGTTVTLELKASATEATIRVIDQGIGIPEEDVERLFEPFTRASNVGGIQGTGLGLAITKQAIELHHGSIQVKSRLGKGTTFVITLPLEG